MKRKLILGVVVGMTLCIVGAVVGLLAGMYIGGNYFVDFEFGGVRGYEAAGKLGAFLGAALGAASGVFLGVKLADARRKRR